MPSKLYKGTYLSEDRGKIKEEQKFKLREDKEQ